MKLHRVVSAGRNSVEVIVKDFPRQGQYRTLHLKKRSDGWVWGYYYFAGFKNIWDPDREIYNKVPIIEKVPLKLEQEILAKL